MWSTFLLYDVRYSRNLPIPDEVTKAGGGGGGDT